MGRDRLLYLQTRGAIEVQAHPRADRLAVDASVDDPLHIRRADRGRGHQQEPRALVNQSEQRLHGLLRGKVPLVEYHGLCIEPTGSLYDIQKRISTGQNAGAPRDTMAAHPPHIPRNDRTDRIRPVVATNYVAHARFKGITDTYRFAQRLIFAVHPPGPQGGYRTTLMHPPCSVTVQGTSRVSAMGGKSRAHVALAFAKAQYILSRHDRAIGLSGEGTTITNVVCAGQTHPVNLERMRADNPGVVRYSPERFRHAAFVYLSNSEFAPTRVVVQCFETGKCNIAGARSEEEARAAFEFCDKRIFAHAWIENDVATNVTLAAPRTSRIAPVAEPDEAARRELDAAIAMFETPF